MKVSVKTIIFAIVLGSLSTTANIAQANDLDSAKNEVLLAKGAEVSFANFMNKNAKNFVKLDEWNVFSEVVTLYNVSPSKFLKVSSSKREDFNEAVSLIKVKLSKMRGEDAKVFLNKVTATSSIINILWNNNFEIIPSETEQVEAPLMIEMIGK